MEKLSKEELNTMLLLYKDYQTVKELEIYKALLELKEYREAEEK